MLLTILVFALTTAQLNHGLITQQENVLVFVRQVLKLMGIILLGHVLLFVQLTKWLILITLLGFAFIHVHPHLTSMQTIWHKGVFFTVQKTYTQIKQPENVFKHAHKITMDITLQWDVFKNVNQDNLRTIYYIFVLPNVQLIQFTMEIQIPIFAFKSVLLLIRVLETL